MYVRHGSNNAVPDPDLEVPELYEAAGRDQRAQVVERAAGVRQELTVRAARGVVDAALDHAQEAALPPCQRALDVDLGDGLVVRMASLRDVIRMKEASNRVKDQAQLPALRQTLEVIRRRERNE